MNTPQTPQRSPSGVPGLDDVLHGGLMPGRLYLIQGSPGSGKTTLSLHYLLEGAKAGERCLYITLAETREELIDGANSHGFSLEGVEIAELLVDERDIDGQEELTMYHPSEVELTRTMRRVLDEIERVRPQRLIFDSLSELRLLAQSSLRYRRQILALKQYFNGRDCTVLMLDDLTGEGPDMQLQSIAHGVVALEHRAPAFGRALRQLQVIKFRGSDYRSGHHDFNIRRGGVEVYPRLAASEHGRSFERGQVASGVPKLDALFGGGVDLGTSTLLVGPPGSGKSTIALQYAAAAAQRGDHAAVFAFDESKSIMLARSAGIGMHLPQGRGPGEILIRQIDPSEVAPGEFAHMVRLSVEQDHARVVIIDSLTGYLNAMSDSQLLTAQLHELLSFLNNHGVATFLVTAQTGLIGASTRSPVDASYLADSVVMLRMFEHSGRIKKAISVAKKRSGAHEESIRQLWFDGQGIHLSEPLTHLRGVLSGVPVESSVSSSADQLSHQRVNDVG